MRGCTLGFFAAMLLTFCAGDLNGAQRRQLAISAQEGVCFQTEYPSISFATGALLEFGIYGIPRIEIAYAMLPSDIFVFASYRGITSSMGLNEQFRSAYRVNVVSIGLSKSLEVGRGAFAPRAGFCYSAWKYEIEYHGESYPSIYSKEVGFIVGGQLSAPMTDSIELLLGYELLLRPSMHYAGRFRRSGEFTLNNSGKEHFIFLGITCWVL